MAATATIPMPAHAVGSFVPSLRFPAIKCIRTKRTAMEESWPRNLPAPFWSGKKNLILRRFPMWSSRNPKATVTTTQPLLPLPRKWESCAHDIPTKVSSSDGGNNGSTKTTAPTESKLFGDGEPIRDCSPVGSIFGIVSWPPNRWDRTAWIPFWTRPFWPIAPLRYGNTCRNGSPTWSRPRFRHRKSKDGIRDDSIPWFLFLRYQSIYNNHRHFML
mmetsp:Transcript_27753/g.61125  ORF Transcript_27753/g.61125 Transcript_27753/m.61125 type:complete len:216 (+) Transcript_27753:389-1036(+)